MKKTQIYSSFAALLLLSGCGFGTFWDNFTGEREPQTVNGARRVPELNAKNMIIPNAPPTNDGSQQIAPLAPMVTTAVKNTSPYDNYDANGNVIGAVAEKPVEKQPAPAPLVRKPFAGNLQPLTAVPEKPKEFDAVKASSKQNLDVLQADKSVATKDKVALDSDVATEKMSPIATPVVTPVAKIKPLIAPPVSQPAPQTLQLPASVAPQSKVVSKPIPLASLPEIKIDAPVQPAADATIGSVAPPAQSTDALPSPEIVKTLPPSRYSNRIQQ